MKTILDFPLDQMFRRVIRFISLTTADQIIDDEIVPPGRIHIIQRLGFLSPDGAFNYLYAGPYDGAEWYMSEWWTGGSTETLFMMRDPIYLFEGDRLRIKVTNLTAGEVLECYIQGFYAEIER